MTTPLNTICLNLIEATVTLYPANADGTPQLAAPIWCGAAAENLHGTEKWLQKETMPSGARYPVKHLLVPQYEISIGRLWVILETEYLDWLTLYSNYVLDIVWVEEETQEWHRKTFYGVTINERGWDAKDVENGLMENQSFAAQYYVPDGGAAWTTPPIISPALPYQVIYTDATGSVLLYTYDQPSNVFTAVAALTGRANIGYSGGAFAVQFAGDATAVVRTTVNSLLYRNHTAYRNSQPYNQAQFQVRGGIFSGVPAAADLPRLDFYYGSVRVCAITTNGLFDVNFDAVEPSAATGKFGILAGSNLIATLAAGEVDAKNFVIVAS
jgi:hypothetical protein